MVVMNIVIEEKKCRGKDTHFRIDCNLLKREDAKEKEILVAKIMESACTIAVKHLAEKINSEKHIG